ncbi:MAG TPA: YetF domain-containing protein [Burkholderiales bacterium]|nr:YetF domain-containing protein [Burkholderiales bacterium]
MEIDWTALFSSSVPALELVVRGSAIYWFIFLLFRVILRRNVGAIAISDVLLVVLIADAAQNGMAGQYDSITDGFILVGTIAAWSYLIDFASYRSQALRRLLEPQPLPLVRDGRLERRNLRSEFMSRDELLAQLREKGVERIEDVKVAYMESDGSVSVIQKENAARGAQNAERRRKP